MACSDRAMLTVGVPYDGEPGGAALRRGRDSRTAPVAALRGVAQPGRPRERAGNDLYAGQLAKAGLGSGGGGRLVVLDDDVLGHRVEVRGERRTARIG